MMNTRSANSRNRSPLIRSSASLLVAAIGAIVGTGAATASTTLTLDTGYNHAVTSYYPTGAAVQDQFWVRYAYSGQVTATPPMPITHYSRVTSPQAPGASLVAPARSLNSHDGLNSPPLSSGMDPGYVVYRKCFCLAPNLSNDARINLQITGDDTAHIWLNTMTNTLLAPISVYGVVRNVNWPQTGAGQGFWKGRRNCIYVLMEDNQGGPLNSGGQAWFALKGSISATSGLWDQAATGLQPLQTSYLPTSPCKCDFPQGPLGTAAGAPAAAMRMVDESAEDRAMLAEITRYAETRRQVRRNAIPSTGTIAPLK